MKKMTLQMLVAIFCLFISSTSLLAQTNQSHDHDRCGTMENLEILEKEHPEIIKNRAKIEAHTQKTIKSKNPLQKVNGLITIPIVVHVLHHTPQENISYDQVLSQINVLNEDFRRLNADASNTPADFLPVAADTEIEFCLATRDPNGNPTTGITRTQSSQSVWGFYDDLKYSSQGGVDAWNTSEYLNIWVCNLAGGILGYAQFPGGPVATDGVVCTTTAFGNTGYVFPPFDLGRTITHEVGHWLNLYHIWGDGDCTEDDLVTDTPNAAFPNFTSSPCTYPGANGCDDGIGDLPDMFQNYMDYSEDACFNLFTTGQKDRMRVLFEPGGFRESLLNSTGCDPLPVHCSNDIQDGDETDVDCGGSCLPCPSCNDDIQNGDETGVDCGGSNCLPCPSCNDGIQNADEIGIDCGGAFCAPCNDLCEGAENLGCGDTLFGSTDNSSYTDLPATCGNVVLPDGGVWFSFEGTGEEMILSTDHEGTNYDTNLQLYSGDCNDLTCVTGDEDGGETYFFGFTSTIHFSSEPGTVYYLYLSGFFGQQGNYELSLECYFPLAITVDAVLGIPNTGIGTGSIGITATGGYTECGPLTYAWTGPGGYTATTEDAMGLTVAGIYTLIVTDCLGNEETVVVDVPVRTRGRGRSRKADFVENTQLKAIPNPFTQQTSIHFEVANDEELRLEVFDIRGAKVATLFEGTAEAGQSYQVPFGADSMPVGTYIAHLTTANGDVQHIKLLLIK